MMAYDIGTARGVIEMEYNGRGVSQAKDDLNEIDKAGGSTAQSMRRVSSTFLASGAAMVGGVALAINSAANFEQRISAIAAVSGATGSELDKLRGKALQLGKDTQFSASESAQAMEELVKAGLSVDDVLNGAADATVALAAAGSVDMPTAATISANAMNQFNLTAKDMTGVVDEIAGAANASAIDVGDLGESIQQVGAVANLAGVNFKDTATAIALMGNAGIKGSDAGTSLKSMFQRLIPVTTQQINEFQRLGLLTLNHAKSQKVLAENGIKGAVTAKQQADAWAKLGAELSGSEVGSAKAQKAAQKLQIQSGALSNQFYDQKGNMKDLASVSDGLQKSLAGMDARQKQATLTTLFGSDAIRAAAVLSNQGAKGFTDMAKSMGKVSAADVAAKRMDNFKGSLEQMKGSLETAAITGGTIFLPMIRKVVDGVTSLLNSFLNLPQGVQTTIVVLTAVIGVMLLVVGGIMKIIIFVSEFSKALAVLKVAMAETWIAALGPIALVIAAIAAIVIIIIILWKKSETFRDIVKGVWNAIKSAAQAVANWFTGTLVPAFQSAWDGIIAGLNAIGDFFQSVWDAITSVVQTAVSIVATIIRTYINIYVTIIRTVLGVLMAIWKGFWNTFGGIITAVFQLIVAVIQLWLAIIVLAIQVAWNAIKAATSAVWNAIVAVISAVWGFIVGIVQREINGIKAIITAVWNAIKAVSSAVWNAIAAVINAVWGRIGGTVMGAVNRVRSAVTGAWNAVKSATSTAWNALAGFVSTGINKLMTHVNAIKGKVTGALSGAIGWLRDAGHDIIQGLLDGITDMINKVTDKLHSLTKMIKDAKGPEDVDKVLLEPAGKQIMQSLIDGFAAMEPDVVAQLQHVTNLIAPAVVPPAATVAAPHPTPTPGGAPSGLRLVSGELRLDKSGRAFISGVAADTMDGADEVGDLLGRMG